MKNTNESITDIFKMFKKEKVYTVEDFFRISTGSPKEQGVKGLILKMVDVMTPDINMKARDQGDARAQATRYLVDYIRDSFIWEVENLPTRSANDWEDFAKFIESSAWGENIGWDSLIKATKDLYDHAAHAHTEALPGRKAGGGLTGDPNRALDQLQLMLGVNTIPLVLLTECLRALGKRMVKARKYYNKKRISKPMSENKILENYIKTEGLFDLLTKGSADKEIDKKPKEGSPCKVRGDFRVHKIHNGKCTPVDEIQEEKFEDTPYGQMVADEINKIVSEMPEIKLGLEVLAEQDDEALQSQIQELGRTEAMKIMTAFKTKIAADLQGTLEEVMNELGYS